MGATIDQAAPGLAERLGPVHVALRPDLEFSRHVFGGEPSYVARDPVTFRCHSFSAADYRLLRKLDPNKSLSETFAELVDQGLLDADRQEEFYHFILALHRLTFLSLPISDGGGLYQRFRRRRTAEFRGRLLGALFLQVPLFNPDAFLSRTVRWVAPLFTRAALVAWVCLVSLALAVVVARWRSFWDPAGSLLSVGNLAYLWVSLVGLKVLHEFGHAYACKRFGGRVPEMGAFFIVFTPCAYVDATDCWGFPSRLHRVIVGLAGMYVESIVAALAVFVWAATGPSTLHALAHQLVLLSSVVTLGFNLNPLMRYDGYYVLGDLVGIPNLRQRSQEELLGFVKRWTLGVRASRQPAPPSRRAFLIAYALASTAYKAVLVLGIFSIIATKVYLLGLVLAVAYAGLLMFRLGRTLLVYLWRSPETAPVRGRAKLLGLAVVVGAPLAVALVPYPYSTRGVGVVGRQNESPLYVEEPGFLRTVLVQPGANVKRGQRLVALENPEVGAQLATLRADRAEEEVRARRAPGEAPEAIHASQQRLAHLRHAVADAEQEAARLDLRAPDDGQLVLALDARRPGRFLHAGERVATIVSGDWVVRTKIDAEQLAALKPRVGQRVDVQLVGDAQRRLTGTIQHVSPAGTRRIDLPALTHLGGGDIAVTPSTGESERPFFTLTISLPRSEAPDLRFGSTALVRARGPSSSIGYQLYLAALRFIDRLRARE